MPIFQTDLEHEHGHERCSRSPAPVPVAVPTQRAFPIPRRLSEESVRTDLCEGPVLDTPDHASTMRAEGDGATSDRGELIERLKRGESPTWIPNRHLESMLHQGGTVDIARPPRSPSHPPGLLPPAQITPESDSPAQGFKEDRLQDGLNIERPGSALHSGDFAHSHRPAERQASSGPSRQSFGSVETIPWIATSPPRNFTSFHYGKSSPLQECARSFQAAASPLSTSLSNFVFQPPTSPLVQSESNDELEFPMPPEAISLSTEPFGRRGDDSLHSSKSSPSPSPSSRHSIASWTPQRRDGSLPYQAHQPRRSLTSTPSFLPHGTSPQTAAMVRSRRPSLSSDMSPIQHASMVGSYEESILRGRMSTTPSQPFDFLAQIGVLGRGKCKPSLRCPPHVTLPFPAVYYNYGGTPHLRSRSDDGPSPYVGQIDLENGLVTSDEETMPRNDPRDRNCDRTMLGDDTDMDMNLMNGPGGGLDRWRMSPKQRFVSPKAPPGGSYRIPEKGQIQIIIKNQNKTAVKLFLVPYDLSGMEPGTKTFIRQRSYSAGPIIDNIPNPSETDGMSRPMLRYLVHLHMCCPSRGRFYLYKSIRVVFANRVPEGKEKLRNETTWPEPRFTPYKPIRAMHPPASSSTGPGATLAAEKAFRRRSLGVAFGGASSRAFDAANVADMGLMPVRVRDYASSNATPAALNSVSAATPRLG
ncbi:hypothetical protein DCS_00315 [Drechmeria coniospora]|uniref:Atos-like conserved domain-containing protein n=1 Tax=Drechmeria coniospora TaxID=98403 RepID=A0A151GPZ1_DRECN|nr:hypothetical protein DCS_00315 [Drechmeria coniospora]KYK59185.1 hypothetical protein DCS_00315 [Drechmeria coniospora]